MKEKRFNDILDKCLDRILKGETIEQCLRSYPEQAQELEPLLRAALTAKTASTIQPRPEYKARARYEFQAALRDKAVKKERKFFNWHPHWRWTSGWAVAIMAVIGVVLAGGSTVAAAGNSMPDSALYPVKLATEQVQLAVASSKTDKAELIARFADQRAEEIAYLASKGDTQRIQDVAERFNNNLERISDLTATENGSGANQKGEANKSIHNNQTNAAVPGSETPAAGFSSTPVTPNPTAEKSPGQSAGEQQQSRNENTQAGARQKLKQTLNNQYNYCQSRLEEALKKASPEARPTILRAIAESQASHDKALNNLKQTGAGR